jgi:hypothetical protein
VNVLRIRREEASKEQISFESTDIPLNIRFKTVQIVARLIREED